jgi:hypothetical protein
LVLVTSENVTASGESDVTIPILIDGRPQTQCPNSNQDYDPAVEYSWQGAHRVFKWANSSQGDYSHWPEDQAFMNLGFYPQFYTYGVNCKRDILDFLIITRSGLDPNWRFDNNHDGAIVGQDEDPLMLTNVEITIELLTPDANIPIYGELTSGWSNEYYGSYSYSDWRPAYPVDTYTFSGDSDIKTTRLIAEWYEDFLIATEEWKEEEAKKEFGREMLFWASMITKGIATAFPNPVTGGLAAGTSFAEFVLANTLLRPEDPPLAPNYRIDEEVGDMTMAAVFSHPQEYLHPSQKWGHTAYTKGDYGLYGNFEIDREYQPQLWSYDWEITAISEFQQYWGGYSWFAEDSIIVTMDNNIDHKFVKDGWKADGSNAPTPVAEVPDITDEWDYPYYTVVLSAENTVPGDVNELYYKWDYGYEINNDEMTSPWRTSSKTVHYYPHDCFHYPAVHNMCGNPFKITLYVSDTRYVRSIDIWIDDKPPWAPLPKADPQYGGLGLVSTVTWDPVEDPGSGVKNYEWALDQTVSWSNIGLSTGVQVGPLTGGDHIVYVRAVDNFDQIGNYGSVHIYIDTPPAPPTDLTSEFDPSSLDNIKLEWTLSIHDGQLDDDIIRYDIHRSASLNGIYYFLDSVPAGTNTYIDVGGSEIDTNSWFYSVTAVTDNLIAAESSERAGKFVLPLDAGYSFVSFLPRPKDTSTGEVLKYVRNREPGFGGILYWEIFDHKWKDCWHKGKTWCDIPNLDNSKGFWIYMYSPGSLVVTGSIHQDESVWLPDFYGYFGYPFFTERTVSEAFLGVPEVEDVYEQKDGFCDTPTLPGCYRKMADTDIMRPGKGYLIYTEPGHSWDLANDFEQISIEEVDEINPPLTEDDPCLPEWTPGGHCRLRRFDLMASGVDYSKYRIDGGNWETYDGSLDVTEGYHTMEFYSVDKKGNVESEGHGAYENYALVDSTSPETDLFVLDGREGSNDWYISPLLLTFFVNAGGAMEVVFSSGIESTKYEIDGDGNWLTFDDSFWYDGQGISQISYYSEDVAGNVESTEEGEVKIDTTLPTVSLLQPLDGTSTQNQQPTFQWEGLDSIPGSGLSNDYQIQISTYSEFGDLSIDEWVQGESYTPPSPLDQDTYYWRVRAKDNAGNTGKWSSSWTISIRAPPPTTTLLSPPDGTWTNDDTPTFEWEGNMQGPPGLSGIYRIQVSFVSDFSSTVLDTEVTGTTYTPGSPLIDDWYYWHVKAKDNDEVWGDWSGTRLFVIDTVAPNPLGSLTAILEDTPTDLLLNWDLSHDDGSGFDDVLKYEIFRSLTIDGPYAKIGEVDRQVSGWLSVGDGWQNPSEHYYRVDVIDRAGNVGSNDYTRAGKKRIQLYPGENYVSIPLVQYNSTTTEVLKSIAGEYSAVEWYSASMDQYFVYKPLEDTWPYNLTDIDHKIGFMMNVTMMNTLTVAGAVPITTAVKLSESHFRSYKFPGEEGFPHIFGGANESELDFNWVGLPSLYQVQVGELRNQIVFSEVKKFDPWLKTFVNMSDSDYMVPGEGYFINVTDIVDSLDNTSFFEIFWGSLEGGDISSTSVNDGDYLLLREESYVEGAPQRKYVKLNVTFEFPLSPGSDSWTFYVDSFIAESYNDSFVFKYQNPETSEWIDMFTMEDDWRDDENGSLPSRHYEFPFGTFNNSYSMLQYAYVRIVDNNSEECDPGFTNVSKDLIAIDRMFMRSKSSFAWEIENLISPIVFGSHNISLGREFPPNREVLNITATIWNIGEEDLERLVVSFLIFSDQEDFSVGVTTPDFHASISNITAPAGGFRNVSVKWEVAGNLQIIMVVVDHNPSSKDGYLTDGYAILETYGPVSF